jgi:hypothetical protein
MLLRLAAYIFCIDATWHMVDYVFMRNQMAGIYLSTSDTSYIQIIKNQVILLGICVLIFPTTCLGSTWVMRKLSEFRRLFQVLALLPCALGYALSILICLNMAIKSSDSDHIEIGICYGVILLLISVLMVFDVIGIDRHVYKRHLAL